MLVMYGSGCAPGLVLCVLTHILNSPLNIRRQVRESLDVYASFGKVYLSNIINYLKTYILL